VIESEIKIPVAELDSVRHLLVRIGAEQLNPTQDEVNTLFDSADGAFASSGRALRVRRVGDRSLLTFKGPARWEGAIKHRQEIELEVSSSETIAELLHALGFAPWIRYEKRRESWILDGVRVELDRTPIGDFVELEGPVPKLEDTARTLGLEPERAVAESYVGLWQAHRRRHPELGRDMVFES
jgi:adenylate cyclase class 2